MKAESEGYIAMTESSMQSKGGKDEEKLDELPVVTLPRSFSPTDSAVNAELEISRRFDRAVVNDCVLDESWEWNGKGLDELPGLAKWMFKLNKQQSERFDPKVERELLMGLFRGYMGERISGALKGLDQAESVFSTIPLEDLTGLELIDPADVEGGPNKGYILAAAVRAGLSDFSPNLPEEISKEEAARFDAELKIYLQKHPELVDAEAQRILEDGKEDIHTMSEARRVAFTRLMEEEGFETRKEAIEAMKEDIALGLGAYGYKASKKWGLEESDPGILHFDSEMPDGFAPGGEGPVEVKSLKPYELKAWIEALLARKVPSANLTEFISDDALRRAGGKFVPHSDGKLPFRLNIDAEVQFTDDVRAGHSKEGVEPLGRDAFVILRFPKDANENDLKALGKMLHEDLHFSRVLIQRMPFTSDEIDELALEAVASQRDLFAKPPEGTKGRKGMTFKDRELQLIGSLVGEDWSPSKP